MNTLLVAGCGGVSSPGHETRKASSLPPEKRARAASSERSGERLAEAHAHYGAGVIHDMNDETEAALKEYYQAALKDPGNESLILEVSGRFLQSKQPEKALELLIRATERPDSSAPLFARLGLVYSQLGRHEEAIAAGRTAIKRSSGSLAGYQNLYLEYLQDKHAPEALNALDEAAKQPGTDAEFLIRLGELYANLGQQVPAQKESANAKGLAVLNRAEALHPASPLLRLNLADGFNLLGDSSKAARLYVELLNKFPNQPQIRDRVRGNLATIYLQGSDHKLAAEQLEAIIRDDPTNPQAYYDLGVIAYEEGKMPEAADYFSKTILFRPDFERAYYQLAQAQIALNKTSDALATLAQARRKFSESFVMELLTGMAFGRQKAYPEAIQHYTAAEVIAQATNPKALSKEFYLDIGAAYERKGDYAEAEKYFQKCLELAPDFAEVLNYLGYMWAEHGVNLEKARELIERALKAEPKSPAYLDSLAWVLFKLNQPKDALEYAVKAVELSPEPDATIYDHLGDIYAALTEPEKAREAWRKSLALESSEEVRKKIESEGAR